MQYDKYEVAKIFDAAFREWISKDLSEIHQPVVTPISTICVRGQEFNVPISDGQLFWLDKKLCGISESSPQTLSLSDYIMNEGDDNE